MISKKAKIVFVDVDGVLLIRGRINQACVDFCRGRKADGFELYLWSGQGQAHAEDAAKQADIIDLFAAILPKPGYIVDDFGWEWTRWTEDMTGSVSGIRRTLMGRKKRKKGRR